ncbi:MAG: hypothetical protein AAGI11_15050 [Pseudomonadota bacterium]
MKERSIRFGYHNAKLMIRTDKNDETLLRSIMKSTCAMLRKHGWNIWVPYEEHAHAAERHGKRFARSCAEMHRKGECRGLELEAHFFGRLLEIQFWEDIIDHTADNSNGGRHIFDKVSKMPFVTRIHHRLTCLRVLSHLHRHYEVEVEPIGIDRIFDRALSRREKIEADIKKCVHYKPELGRRSWNGDYNRKSMDGALLDEGQRVYFRDYCGRWATGITRYNINNMWWVVSNGNLVHNVACFEISTSVPTNLRERMSGREKSRAIERHIDRAVKHKQYFRAHLIHQQLEAA